MFVLDMTASVLIEQPIETVLAYMDDIEREAEWQPYLREWSPSPDPKKKRRGTQRRYVNQFMGRRIMNVYAITDYVCPARVMYRSAPEAAVQAVGGTTWESVAGGTCVTLIFRPELGDVWGLVPKPIVRWIYGRTLRDDLIRLRARLEAGS